jgi:integrase
MAGKPMMQRKIPPPAKIAESYRLTRDGEYRWRATWGNDLVFSTTGHSSPSGFSKAKRALDARMKEILGPKFKEWRVHDLRRTCATGMENLGIDTRVVETALNHVSGVKAGIVGIYQRAEHREAVKAAFEAWGRHVANPTGAPQPSNVVPLKRAV